MALIAHLVFRDWVHFNRWGISIRPPQLKAQGATGRSPPTDFERKMNDLGLFYYSSETGIFQCSLRKSMFFTGEGSIW